MGVPKSVRVDFGVNRRAPPGERGLGARPPKETAERAGFEPAVPVKAHTISSRAPSTTRSPLPDRPVPAAAASAVSRATRPLGGERGIRTHGTLAGTLDFESSAFDHSASSPRRKLAVGLYVSTRFRVVATAPDSLKEPSEPPSAFVCENTAHNREPVVETNVRAKGHEADKGTRFRIVCSVHHPSNASVNKRARAHRTWFESDVTSVVRETKRTEASRGRAKRDQFSMGRRVLGSLAEIMTATDDTVVTAGHHRTDRNLTERGRDVRLDESSAHEAFVKRVDFWRGTHPKRRRRHASVMSPRIALPPNSVSDSVEETEAAQLWHPPEPGAVVAWLGSPAGLPPPATPD